MVNAATGILFIEFPELHIHLDPFIDSVYISGSCCFRLYFFFRRDFAVLLMHPLFDPAAPYIVIPLYMAYPFLSPPAAPTPALVVPVAAALTAPPPASPPQQVPSISLSEEKEDPLEATNSSSLSSAPSSGYAPVDAGMANGFLSSKSI